ncbi:MAG: glycosyltransferase [Candidatus Moranbacteria bacterium]|nr:glycosyltransferase [Candidatus Moranbacteria bacterium]
MKILVTNNHLRDKAGSEIFTKMLAIELQKRGNDVFVFSFVLGEISDEIKKHGIRVSDNLLEFQNEKFDIIHAQHNTTAILARSVFPKTPMIFMSHGVLPELEQSPSLNLDICRFLAVSEEVKNNLIKSGVDDSLIEIIRNFVDTKKFKITKKPNGELKNIMVLSNHYMGEVKENLDLLSKKMNFNLIHVGLPENPVSNVEDSINESDLVVTLGRGALESMSCGRNVLVYDIHGGDGMIDENSFWEIRKNNFSGRRFSKRYNIEELEKEISKYNKDTGLKLRGIIEKENSIDVILNKIIKIYSECIGLEVNNSQIRKNQLLNEFNFFGNTYRALQNSFFDINAKNQEIERTKEEVKLNTQKIVTEISLEIQNIREANKKQIEEKESEIFLLRQDLEQEKNNLNAILKSNSWKITRPIRLIKNKILRIRSLIKYAIAVYKKEGACSLIKRITRFLFKKLRKVITHIPFKNKYNKFRSISKKIIYIYKTEGITTLLKKIFFYFKKRKAVFFNQDNVERIALDIFNNQQKEYTEELINKEIKSFKFKPLLSIVMPVYNTPPQWLEIAIESLEKQFYENWELCIVDDFSTNENTKKVLKKHKNNKKLKIFFSKKNGGISKSSNIALDMASGEYIGLLDHDDELTPDALFWVAKALNEDNKIDFIYTDECKIDDSEKRKLFQFIFKPDWSPELLFNCMYTGHFTVYKKDLIKKVGGFRREYDFSQDYDLALRCSEKAQKIHHIERVLYLWRAIEGSAAKGGKDFARKTNIAALQDAIKRRGLLAEVLELPHANYVHFLKSKEEKVSIIVPSDSVENVTRSIVGIKNKTEYSNYEIIIVCNIETKNKLKNNFIDDKDITFVEYNKKFNFSDKCNEGAKKANGEILVFYNDDVIPIKEDWLSKLIEYLDIPKVGAVSPKLLFENERIQYAGMITGVPGLTGTAYNNYHKDETDEFLTMHRYVRDVSVLSGACFAIKKVVFNKVGRFNETDTPSGHSDVDLSFRIRDLNLRCVFTPYSLLTHIGNHSWNSKKEEKDKADIYLLKKWGKYLRSDPYFTESMKKVLYKDFIYNFKIYPSGLENNKNCKNIILISHQLTITGAPRMLFYAARILKEHGFFPVIISPVDGPLRADLEKNNITVIIDESLYCNQWVTERFIKNFDLILANTIANFPIVKKMNNYNLPIFWWIHEAKIIEEIFIPNHENEGIIETLKSIKNKIYVPSVYTKKYLNKYNKATVLINGIEDIKEMPIKPKELIFGIVGTVEKRKSQDIFIEAVIKLPKEYREKAKFFIIGDKNNSPEFSKTLEEKTNNIKEVVWFGLITDSEKKIELFSQISIFVTVSRDDPAPLVVAEASMLGRASIISNNVGSDYLIDKDSGFVVETENVEQLKNTMMKIIDNPEMLVQMGKRAREKYLETSTMEIFSKNLIKEVENVINNYNVPRIDQDS